MEWIEVKGKVDVQNLLKIFGHFHDSCLKELYMWGEHYVDSNLSMFISCELDRKVRLLFQRQARQPSAIELLFEQVTELHIIPRQENQDSILLGATFLYENGLFYWADVEGWKPGMKAEHPVSLISGKKVKWRDASEWMGKEVRYGGQ